MASAFSVYHGAANASSNGSSHTLTALSRWSSISSALPAVDKIKDLHVYDFDNTLFKTPTPNPALWNGSTTGMLMNQDVFANGGWWHDSCILAATGDGLEKEEARAWQGWWNDKVVELARLSMKQPDALCVLLTGRSEHAFTDLLKKMVTAKGLKFDILALKPRASPTNQRFRSTMHFKQIFLDALMETYKEAVEIRLYEDRPKHTAEFRQFFSEYNRRQSAKPTRGPLNAEVIQVAEDSTYLDPVTEVVQVQHMINSHNDVVRHQPAQEQKKRLHITKTVFFTSYMVSTETSKRLFGLIQFPPEVSKQQLRIHANNILICPRTCPANLLDKVGGIGSKLLWEVTGTACYNNSLWAASVRPVPSTATYHTDNPVPLMVLAIKKGARIADAAKISQWQPLASGLSFVFEATVGEKVMLRVEREDAKHGDYEGLFAGKHSERNHGGAESDKNSLGHHGGRNETRSFHSSSRGGTSRGRGAGSRGSRGQQARGGSGSGSGRSGRGRGPGFHYRSLDDVDSRGPNGHDSSFTYDDAYPPLQQQRHHAPPSGPKAAQGRGSHHGRGGRNAHRGGQAPSADLQDYY